MIWIILGGVPLLVGVVVLMCIDPAFRFVVGLLASMGLIVACATSVIYGIGQL